MYVNQQNKYEFFTIWPGIKYLTKFQGIPLSSIEHKYSLLEHFALISDLQIKL